MKILLTATAVLLLAPGWGSAQAVPAKAEGYRYNAEGYAFVGRRNSTPGTSVGGVGGELFVFKGLAANGDVTTTLGNPDDRVTVGSVGASYHFLCCRSEHRVEPFAGAGFSFLRGNVNAHGIYYPADPGQDRNGANFNQGLILWLTKHLGTRLELREYRFFVSYGALENVIPGGRFVEFRVAVTLR